jgi:hypothetical protein
MVDEKPRAVQETLARVQHQIPPRVVKERDTTALSSIKQKRTRKKEEEAMAERDTDSGLFTDIANSIVSTMRDVASRSIDANVTFAKQMLDYQTQTTSWAKDTPMGPMFQSQHALGEGLIELFAGTARALWRIEQPKSES